jgi:glycosyltransferase involved in cell wall biosynthesis
LFLHIFVASWLVSLCAFALRCSFFSTATQKKSHMRILFLTQVLPYPLDAGPKVRAYYVLRYLAQTHRLTLLSFVRPTDSAVAVAHLQQFCETVHPVPMSRSRLLDGTYLVRSLVTGRPFVIERDRTVRMLRVLEEVVQACGPFDAVHADQLWMAPYALRAKEMAAHRPLAVMDQHNAVYRIFERLHESAANPLMKSLLRLEAHKLARFEVDICRRFDHVTWVTQEDYEAVQRKAPASAPGTPNSGVIPICVDTNLSARLVQRPNARRVTFLGGLHYPPNAEGICWFAEQVFGQVLAAVPDALLTVIGKQPPARLMQLDLPRQNLEITGYVEDPTPYLAETAVFIVPLHAGGGMRVKILDAWAWGLPIVSTTVGAEGIETRPGQNILIADQAASFAQAVIDLLRQPALGRGLGESGRQWVERQYEWRSTYRQWDAIYA